MGKWGSEDTGQYRANRKSRNEQDYINGSQQADDNMDLTFLRHLPSRFAPQPQQSIQQTLQEY